MSARPLLLGHRGARATRALPENSLASFDLALSHGCDGFEFDVRLTRDGAAVVCHDPRDRRKLIARATSGDLHWLPRLAEVLERYRERAFLDIELKVSGLEELVAELLKKYPPQRGFVVSSFLPEVLERIHQVERSLPRGLIGDREAQLTRWRDLGVQYVIPHFKLVTPALLDEVHGAGKKLFVWTVNEREAMLRLAAWPVDGLISDDTEMLVKTLGTNAKGD